MNQQSKRASQEWWHHSQLHCGSDWWDCMDHLDWHCFGQNRGTIVRSKPLPPEGAVWRLTATATPFHTSSQLHVLSIRNISQTEQLSVSTVSAQFRNPLAETARTASNLVFILCSPPYSTSFPYSFSSCFSPILSLPLVLVFSHCTQSWFHKDSFSQVYCAL